MAFKNVIGSRRASWRVIQSIADSETDESRTKTLDEYRTVIETEIETICDEILDIINGLVRNSEDTEPKVFYLKMKGDYLRYLAEFQVDEKKKTSAGEANTAYGTFKIEKMKFSNCVHYNSCNYRYCDFFT